MTHSTNCFADDKIFADDTTQVPGIHARQMLHEIHFPNSCNPDSSCIGDILNYVLIPLAIACGRLHIDS
jgi:hypothetical protein